ncbi:MAG TPA: hypothetical protein VL550_02520, partial [Rhodocyclaceae bacterium]|nr:hypothetical protein [Rhodocyclaceae bacterium]
MSPSNHSIEHGLSAKPPAKPCATGLLLMHNNRLSIPHDEAGKAWQGLEVLGRIAPSFHQGSIGSQGECRGCFPKTKEKLMQKKLIALAVAGLGLTGAA